jgi:DNA-binding response OmpR family regulator
MTQISHSGPTVPSVTPRCDVIIVEDEPMSRRALQMLVTAHGLASRAFPTAEEALREVAREGVPGIVLVDLHLPGMNGIEFIRRVAQASATVLPVLITAASSDVLGEIAGACAVRCLRKPLEFGRLVAVLNERASAN